MSIRVFLDALRDRNEPLFYFGFICLIAAILCLACVRIIPVQVLGTSAWYKPFKFFLSTAIFVWSMAWYLHYLGTSPGVTAYAWGMIVLLGVEDVYILVQAARGITSHFNVSSPVYAAWWRLMAFAAVSISLWTGFIGIRFFTQTFPELPTYYLWGIRLGFIVFVIFSMEGMAMGARMAHSVGGPDGSAGWPVLNWSKSLGDLRVAHFLGMHALQILDRKSVV